MLIYIYIYIYTQGSALTNWMLDLKIEAFRWLDLCQESEKWGGGRGVISIFNDTNNSRFVSVVVASERGNGWSTECHCVWITLSSCLSLVATTEFNKKELEVLVAVGLLCSGSWRHVVSDRYHCLAGMSVPTDYTASYSGRPLLD